MIQDSHDRTNRICKTAREATQSRVSAAGAEQKPQFDKRRTRCGFLPNFETLKAGQPLAGACCEGVHLLEVEDAASEGLTLSRTLSGSSRSGSWCRVRGLSFLQAIALQV